MSSITLQGPPIRKLIVQGGSHFNLLWREFDRTGVSNRDPRDIDCNKQLKINTPNVPSVGVKS